MANNPARGEVDLVIGGKTYPVRMSMGAMAEMASALGVQTIIELQDRILQCALPDMPVIVAAALRGSGHDVPVEDVRGMEWQDYFGKFIPAFFRREVDPTPPEASIDQALAEITETDPGPLRRR